MDITKELKDFKRRIDPEIDSFLREASKQSRKEDIFIADAIDEVRDFILAGGKRLRAAMMCYGYLAAGGKKKKEILKASVSIELVHAFLLIHDDIIDRDEFRHGKPTIHMRYRRIGKTMLRTGGAEHFGDSIAIILGDMIAALGSQRIFTSEFSPDRIVHALQKLQSVVSYTVVGEAQDIVMEYRRKASEEDVLSMYRNKTARYTTEGPLHLGAVLAGADEVFLRGMSQYALPLGIAFQIQDDILGVFGNPRKMGKPIGSDIKEGKMTLLVVKAFEEATSEEKRFLLSVLGQDRCSETDLGRVRAIMERTGSLRYAQDMAQRLINDGKKTLDQMVLHNTRAKDFLFSIADFLQTREV